MCTESKDNKVKFIVATVKPNDSESAVLESITMPGIAQTEDNELSLNRYKRVKHF